MFTRISEKLRGRDYPRKKVLVLEGGGMRGIFLTGVLQSFADRDYFPWKLIIGSSAGALTGTAYGAGQIHLARDAYLSRLISREFIQLANILNPEKHIINLDWMIDTFIKGDESLDRERLKGRCPVIITATDIINDGVPETVYLNSQKDDIPVALKASAAIPVLYRGFVNYKDFNLLDGGILDPIPYKKALAMGYKEREIVVVLTRPAGYRKKEESFWIRLLYENYYKDPGFDNFVSSLNDRYLLYNRVLDDLEKRHRNIEVVYPPENFEVNRLTRDREVMLKGFMQGIQAGKDYLFARD